VLTKVNAPAWTTPVRPVRFSDGCPPGSLHGNGKPGIVELAGMAREFTADPGDGVGPGGDGLQRSRVMPGAIKLAPA